MNIQASELLRSMYAIDASLRVDRSINSIISPLATTRSKYFLLCAGQLDNSKLSIDHVLSIRDKGIRYAIKNGILKFSGMDGNFELYSGVESELKFTFISLKEYRNHSDNYIKNSKISSINDYSINLINLNSALVNMNLIPDTIMEEHSDLSVGNHSENIKSEIRDALGIVNGFDLSSYYKDGFDELEVYMHKNTGLWGMMPQYTSKKRHCA